MGQVLRSADYPTRPWKNRGGVTTEIAASPRGAGLDRFDWRVSMARVESDSPFSNFAGIDRSLVVLDGEGIVLTIGAGEPVALSRVSPPYAFAGDAPTQGCLLGGPITDLNVMTRRGTFSSRVTRYNLNAPRTLLVDARETLLFCAEGTLSLETSNDVVTLGARDAWRGLGSKDRWRLHPAARTLVYLIEVFAVEADRI